jgi:homopolymeric O-antigen transport system permease protein
LSIGTTLEVDPALNSRAAATGPHARHVHIAPSGRWVTINLAELWAYRGLWLFLVWRDIKARYAQTVLGIAWAVLQPLLSMVVFTVVFGRFVRVPSEGVPYPVFSMAGLVPWTYFSAALTGASNSLVGSTSLVTKIYFPRLVIPGAPVLAGLLDLVIAMAMLLIIMLWFGQPPHLITPLLLPFPILLIMMTSMGAGSWLAALHIQYRDIKHITAFVVQVWMYGSPIVYPLSVVPEVYRNWYALNPMAGAIAAFRSAFLGTPGPTLTQAMISFGSATVLLLVGLLYFRRSERVFADVA